MSKLNFRFPTLPQEWKLVSLRECPPSPEAADTPAKIAEYWQTSVATAPHYSPEVEQLAVILLNTRRRIIGHEIIGKGTLDSVLCHPRDVFRIACVANAAAIIVAHNHPSGQTDPSEADTRMAKELQKAGQLMKIELLDSIIVRARAENSQFKEFCSLRELGYLHN